VVRPQSSGFCVSSIRKSEHDWTVCNWSRTTTGPLERLIGLRAHASSNPEIKMILLLRPHQTVTKELGKQVEHAIRVMVFNRLCDAECVFRRT
jgi:hypothetical protein